MQERCSVCIMSYMANTVFLWGINRLTYTDWIPISGMQILIVLIFFFFKILIFSG